MAAGLSREGRSLECASRLERWLSGRKRTTRNRLKGNLPWVRIPPSPSYGKPNKPRTPSEPLSLQGFFHVRKPHRASHGRGRPAKWCKSLGQPGTLVGALPASRDQTMTTSDSATKVLLSLAADQLSAPTSTGSAVSPEPSGPGLKQVPQRSAAWRSARWCRRATPSPRRRSRWCCMSGGGDR